MAPSAYLLGGVQSWLDYLVPGLNAAGWQVTVLLVHGVHSDGHRYLEHHPFPRARLVSNPTGTREGRVRALCRAMADSDLVLVANLVDAYEAVVRLRRSGGGPKVAMALHALSSSFYEDIAEWGGVLDGVIATNRLAAVAAVARGGVPFDRVHYAPCGVMVRELPVVERTPNALPLLFAGRFDIAEKRVLDLVPILRALDGRGINFSLKLAGSGPAEAELRQALLEFGERITFVGVLSESQLQAEFFCTGAIALVLSPSETGPLVAWEAMANGVAVVTSHFVGLGLENALRDGETCLSFPVGNAHAAAAAIERLVDPLLRRSLANAGYEMVRRRYSREASVRAWDTALQQIDSQDKLDAGTAVASPPSAGRLDRYLGTEMAESIRQLIGLRFRHSEPGGEWPHSYHADNNEEFRRLLAGLDQRENSDRMET